MKDLKEEIEKRKELIDSKLDDIFRGKEHVLWELMAWYPQAGGKKLRPFLAMVTAGVFGEDEEKALPLGLAIEMIHNFTLVHDDLMDDDDMRRGRKTLHRKENPASAINAGDALFALAFNLLAESDVQGEELRQLLGLVSTSVMKVAEGQEEDMRFEETFDISEDEFISMIEKKTSYLFQTASKGGAIIGGGTEEEIERMGNYARKMGIAFQIQDDYLDLVGDQDDIGKPVGSDIRRGKRTLMIIHALENLPEEKRERLIEILRKENTDEEIEEAMDLLRETDSLTYCKNLAERYAAEAKKEISFLPDSERKKILLQLVDLVIQREV